MRTRRATLAELEALVPLFEGYRQFYGEAPDAAGSRAFLRDRLLQGDAALFLAEAGRDAIGFTQLYPIFSSTRCRRLWLLNDLFVSPTARGHGAGRALLEAARAFAVESGAVGLELMTARTNTTAQRLYQALGWKLDEVFLHYELAV